MGWLAIGLGAWIGGWWLNHVLSHRPATRLTRLAVPVIFGLSIVVIWESLVFSHCFLPDLPGGYDPVVFEVRAIQMA